ncbi:MAG TPA: DUF4383 domain-containing protein [Candidatus Limnocylindria bacterium]|nr:DUF4383 domain-containing protein [Candidatus Limnocylindria bacterium]
MGVARTVVLVLGAIYVVVGIVGFIPGLVTGGPPAGMESAQGNLLGIFPVNALHNIVHLAIGAALLYGATNTSAAISVARIIGVVYVVVGLLGFVAPDTFGLMPIGGADIFLHLATGAILLAIGFMDLDRGRADARI